MLFLETIDPGTFNLLIKLQQCAVFNELRLVGGTALALQIGHRKSIDIDLFGTIEADEFEISKQLRKIGQITELRKSQNINVYLIDGIKVDIVNYHYPWLEKQINESHLILAGIKDIAAMKLAAITGRGTKKDFIDLYFLLKRLSLSQMLEFYSEKYNDGSEFLVLKSLAYFEDAETDEEPLMLKKGKWPEIKSTIKSTLENFLRNR
jgi:hypothetical protein